jgi:hypothetical protein
LQLYNVYTAKMLHIQQPRLRLVDVFARPTTIGVQ